MLFPVVEVTRSLSNLIKSGFIAFSHDNTLVIDANENKIIKAIDDSIEKSHAAENSMEEALAEALIRDAGLEGEGDDLLTMNTADLAQSEEMQMMSAGVIKSAKDEAEQIINQAHNEAEQIRATAFDEVEQAKAKGHNEGYQDGYEEGMEAATKTLQEKEAELSERQKEIEQYLKEQEDLLLTETEKKMVDLLCQLIPSITGVVLENQKDVLLYMINNAMRDLDNSTHFVIKVSGDDYENVSERVEEIYGALNPNIEMEVFEDAKLGPMQCLIETDHGIVDVSLDVQLDNLIKALKLMVKE